MRNMTIWADRYPQRNPDGTTVTVEYPKASSAGQILENSVITKDGRGNKTKIYI